jgi:hypothetical protein
MCKGEQQKHKNQLPKFGGDLLFILSAPKNEKTLSRTDQNPK